MGSVLEFRMHGDNLLSIKGVGLEIDFSDIRLNNVFEKCIECSKHLFFKGYRPYFRDENIDLLINSYSKAGRFYSEEKSSVLCELSPNSLLMSRNGVKNIWDHYEYPFIFFIGDNRDMESFYSILKEGFNAEDIIEAIGSTFVLFRSFEQDVFWLRKSSNTCFPFSVIENS